MKEKMNDDGEIELSQNMNTDDSFSIDSFIDDLLRNSQKCTHTHTCNPPTSPDDSAHTHTCYHTHTRVIHFEEQDNNNVVPSGSCNNGNHRQSPSVSKSRRSTSGNREAVRKYREKKKAHTAYLEEEVKKLRIVNQHLMKKLQRQAVLEMEASRLRGLLADITGKIDSELGKQL